MTIYKGTIEVEFESLPGLIAQLLDTSSNNPFERFYAASKRRNFHLDKDWNIRIGNADESLNENIVVPVSYNGKVTVLDGASVPLPWLVSFASLGVLRPLGVMLTASVVHDFAYEHGGLLYKKEDGTTEFREIRRDLADDLFRNIIATVNNLPLTSKIAWLAVRLGYFGVKYAGQVKGGEFPYTALAAAVGIVLTILMYFSLLGFTGGIIVFAVFYALAFMLLGASKKERGGTGSSDKTKQEPEAT